MWTLLPVAILAAAVRLAIRVRSKGRLFVDDALLAFAGLTLIVATVILQIELGDIYLAEELVALYISGEQMPQGLDLQSIIKRYHLVQYLHGTMSWLTVFSVKFSFLFFFRQLVDKVTVLERYWKWVFGLNVAACLYCLLYVAFECPYHGIAACKSHLMSEE